MDYISYISLALSCENKGNNAFSPKKIGATQKIQKKIVINNSLFFSVILRGKKEKKGLFILVITYYMPVMHTFAIQ